MAQDQNLTPSEDGIFGPFLFARGGDEKTTRLCALVVARTNVKLPEFRILNGAVVTPQKLVSLFERTYWRFDFTLPASPDTGYSFGSETYSVCADLSGDLRIGFVSCNGQEDGDLDRPIADRNALWTDLADQHAQQPFGLLLHGGDQIYADGVWDCDDAIRGWNAASRREKQAAPFGDDLREAVLKFYLDYYLEIYGQPQISHMLARVPSLMMWDDHDIFDGWGSHKKWFQGTAVAKGIFACARQAFLLMQLCCTDDDLPDMVLDRDGQSLGWRVDLPGMSILAPDLRSERTPELVMGDHGWRDFPKALTSVPDGNRILLLSSVPVIGPRLSLVEMAMHLWPRPPKYEDDLRDQWQSRWHRREWCRFLELLEQVANDHDHEITLLSGEIHLATRGTFETKGKTIHQLVASGISHTAPPQAFARGLGLLAWIGENPLPGRPTRLKPLPERKGVYCAARNYLTLVRKEQDWGAQWHLEGIGWTPELMV
ncbi:alkaline phosphatase family protein [Thalassospira sp. MA62]|nr:alkaline phosphatase family protein [Thalassospira sp. MA62]